jgi:hypothetical protein
MKYMRRDSRWLSLVVATAGLSFGLFAFSLIIYLAAGLGAYTFCLTLMIFSLLLMFPGIVTLVLVYRADLIKKGKIRPKHTAVNGDMNEIYGADFMPGIAVQEPPTVDGEFAPGS